MIVYGLVCILCVLCLCERVRDGLVELLELLHEETEVGLRVVVVDVGLALVVETLVDGVALAEVEGPLIGSDLILSLDGCRSGSRRSDGGNGSLLSGLGRLVGLTSRLRLLLLGSLLVIRELILHGLRLGLRRLGIGLGLLHGLRLGLRRTLEEGGPRGADVVHRGHDVLSELARITEHTRHTDGHDGWESVLTTGLTGDVLGCNLLLDGLTDLAGPLDPPGGLLLGRIGILLLLGLCGLRSGLEGLESGLHDGPLVGQGESLN
jgi:hypothetical protein